MDKVACFLSGEFLLSRRPNGGTAVLLRSLWVTSLIYVASLSIKSYCSKGATLHFSLSQLVLEIGATLPWVGAIFAGAYAAFYTRFAAQWSYLAGLYNQIMETCVSLSDDRRIENDTLNAWYAAFVEDAQDLHLARKSMFKSVVIDLLQRAEIVDIFLDTTSDEKTRQKRLQQLDRLERELDFKAARSSGIDDSVKRAPKAFQYNVLRSAHLPHRRLAKNEMLGAR